MRIVYLNDITQKEWKERIIFLEKSFNLIFYENSQNMPHELISIPHRKEDEIMIYGHNYLINRYLNNNSIQENTILLITCKYGINIPKKNQAKEFYISKTIGGETKKYDGKAYGLNFDVTDTELLLFRHRKDTMTDKIKKSFERMYL